MKVLTDSTGENAKAVNPFEKWKSLSYKDEEPTKEWADFDKAHTSLPLTERQLPNVIVEVELVMREQLPFYKDNEWDDCIMDGNEYICTTGAIQRAFYRPVASINPITPIDEEKGLEDDIYDAVADYRKTHTQPIENKRQLDEGKSDNVLIAEFMGVNVTPLGLSRNVMVKSYLLQELKYQTSWDWLMPVVEKIEELPNVFVDIHREATTIKVYKGEVKDWYTTRFNQETKINHVYKGVSDFIKWYNTQNS